MPNCNFFILFQRAHITSIRKKPRSTYLLASSPANSLCTSTKWWEGRWQKRLCNRPLLENSVTLPCHTQTVCCIMLMKIYILHYSRYHGSYLRLRVKNLYILLLNEALSSVSYKTSCITLCILTIYVSWFIWEVMDNIVRPDLKIQT